LMMINKQTMQDLFYCCVIELLPSSIITIDRVCFMQ
jgi:hypothetical protein